MTHRHHWRLAAGFTLVGVAMVTLLTTTAQAEGDADRCTATAAADWTAQEQWVWARICEREIADLDSDPTLFGQPAGDGDVASWDERRVLSRQFTEAILVEEPFVSALGNRRIFIVGAWFDDILELSHLTIGRSVFIQGSRFEDNIELVGATIEGRLGLGGSSVSGELDLNNAAVAGPVFLSDGGSYRSVDLRSADIDGSLFAGGSEFGTLDLSNAHVGGDVRVSRSRFRSELGLGGATISGDLVLGTESGSAVWRDGALLDLTATTAAGIRDSASAWPKKLELVGFEYGAATSSVEFLRREVSWYAHWLDSGSSYARQPYEQLEGALRTLGRASAADSIAILRRDREQGLQSWWRAPLWWIWGKTVGYGYAPQRAGWLFLALPLIGWWMAWRLPVEFRRSNRIQSPFWFSVARAIPWPRPGRAHKIDLSSEGEVPQGDGVPRWLYRYFVFHTVAGSILALLAATVFGRLIAT